MGWNTSVDDSKTTLSPSTRSSLRMITTAWLFGSAWLHMTTGAAMTRYAQSLGMSEFGFGLLAAIPFAGALLQLPASYLVERYGHRKRQFLVAGLLHRAMWLVIASLPWFTSIGEGWWMLLLAMSVSTSLANFMGPAWVTWMADLVPGRIRGRYFSTRGQYGRAVALVATIAVGWLLDEASDADGRTLQYTISGVLAFAAVCGMLDISLLKGVPDDDAAHGDPHVKWTELLKQPLRDANFRKFLGYNFTLTFAVGYVGQFIWLYLFDVVGLTNMQANLMLVAVPLVVSMLSFPIWGRLVDRFGCRPVLLIAGIMIVHGGASWIFVTKESWWFGFAGSMIATAAWPGVELGTLNLLLRMSQGKDKQRRGSAYVAVHSMGVAIAGTLSGLFGGSLAESMHDWHGSIAGWPLTYHGVLFLISAGLRAASLFWLIGLVEPTAYTTRSALRYMMTNIYSNIQQAVLMPVRGAGMIGRLGRLTYHLIPTRRKPPIVVPRSENEV